MLSAMTGYFDFTTDGIGLPQYGRDDFELEPPFCAYRAHTVDSVYGDYEEESNGPFLSKKDPLLSSSASNLFALSLEAGTVRPPEGCWNQFLASGAQYPSLAQLKQHHALTPLTASVGSFKDEPGVKLESAESRENRNVFTHVQKLAENYSPARRRDGEQCANVLEVKRERREEEVEIHRERESRVGAVPRSTSHVGGSVNRDTPTRHPSRRLRLRSLRAVSHTSLSSGDLSGHESGTDDEFENESSPRKRGRKKEVSDDFNPNPEKLIVINGQLRQLNKMMNDMTPVNEMPTHAKNKGRRERNKLASRACRLKKKATHEANKLKLHGLEREHEILRNAVSELRREIQRQSDKNERRKCMVDVWNEVAKPALEFRVAGRLTEYVNQMLESHTSQGCQSWSSDSDSN